jgi:ParB-like chromosome segregation protein Spo0J
MEKGKYEGTQPRITAAPISTIQPGIGVDMFPGGKSVGKYKKLIEKRGNIVPVTATYAQNGSLALAGGHDIFSAYQNCGAGEIPVIIAETADDSDALLLMLDMMVTHPINHLSVSSCLCRLIDDYMVPRKDIANMLGRSLPWLSLAERIGRRLTPSVKEMLSCGAICMRSAEEIALLPDSVQKPFADRVVSLALNKSQVSRWISGYTGKECSKRARDAMLNDPIAYLKSDQKKKAPPTGYALFTRAMQRCRASLHELARIAETLPGSAIDEAYGLLRELLGYVTELIDRTQDDFTRVNYEEVCE